MDETNLVARVADGDTKALRRLYDAYSARTLAIAWRVLGNRAEAEEVVQDTFLDLVRRAGTYDRARGGVGVWLTSMARNRAIDRLRARGTRRRAAERAAREARTFEGGRPTPLDDIERAETRARMREALEALPAGQRRLLELSFFEGLTQLEIASRMGDPLGTVKSRVRSAMRQLAAILTVS